VAIGQGTANASANSSSDFNAAHIGDTRTIDLGSGVTLTLCYCPAGGFEMGSPPSETDRREDEEYTAVQITRSFWLAKTECTQTHWGRVMNTSPSHFKGDNLPVENVSWDEVQTFITKLNEGNKLPAGWKFSLPSEAQWEYACRAGTKTAFSFGDLLTTQQANFDGTALSNAEKAGASAGSTRAAGTYAANAWGLQDMHGNVWEWCLDAWDGKTSPSGGKDPVGSTGEKRVYRGGSGAYGVRLCRSAYRAGSTPGLHYEFLGFRVAAIQVN